MNAFIGLRNVIVVEAVIAGIIVLACQMCGCAAQNEQLVPQTALDTDVETEQEQESETPTVPSEECVETSIELGPATSFVPNRHSTFYGATLERDGRDSVVTLEDGRSLRIRVVPSALYWHIVGCGVSTGEWRVREGELFTVNVIAPEGKVIISVPPPVHSEINHVLSASCSGGE